MLSLVAALPTAWTPNRTLINGVKMPILSFGANVWDAATCTNATLAALEAGFRFVWSSQLIGDDCQAAQGKAIKSSAVPREQIFISGTANTASCTSLDDCYQKTKAAAESQLSLLANPLDSETA